MNNLSFKGSLPIVGTIERTKDGSTVYTVSSDRRLMAPVNVDRSTLAALEAKP